MNDGLLKYLQNAIGPGTLNIRRVQLWDLYSRVPVYLDADLARKTYDLFNYAQKGPGIQAVNSVAASPIYKPTAADTNIDSPGNNPYDMFVHGLACDFQNLQSTPGTVGTVNDMAFWPTQKAAMLADTEIHLKLNETEVDKLTLIDAPAAGGVVGFGAFGTSAALTVGASMQSAANGWPDAGNFRNYLNEGPFFIEANSTIEMGGTFGNSLLTANFGYKPAATAAPTVFLRAALKGMRIWAI